MDPVSAVAIAGAAFSAIKKGFAFGRDMESMSQDLSRWMGAMSDIKKCEERANKPPLFKKLFFAGSVEEEALNTFMAKKKAEDMREELKRLIMFTRGQSAWNELLKTEADIRKKRQEMLYAQEEFRQKIIDGILIVIASTVMILGISFIVYLIGINQGHWEPIDWWKLIGG
tara:strand:+ start:113 stop:625 length:513 start_codon:yes stop_codon:yes gene_type:complete